MMKANKILTLLVVLTMTFSFTSCVQDDDFKTPDVSVVDPNIDPDDIITFDAVKQRYLDAVDAGDQIGTFEFDQELYIEGYVISSDKAGNFFEELIIQNSTDGDDISATNPRLGLNISINTRGLYETYEVGRKVYIKLNQLDQNGDLEESLGVGMSNGTLYIGKVIGNSLEQIQDNEYRKWVIRGSEVATITPKVTAIGDLTEDDLNTFVQFNDVQIIRNQIGLTYAGQPTDQFDGFRTIESCSDNGSIELQTSTFADFKSLPVAQGRGSIKGIYTRDFGDDFNVLVINSRADVNFDSTDRCDPIEVACGLASTIGTNNLFMDNFETQTINTPISGNGWTNYIEAGTKRWEAYTATGANASLGKSARMGSFSSNDVSSVAWLISPAINLDANTGETLRFKTSNSFSDGSTMQVLFSNDWDGTPEGVTSANWGVLVDAYITQDSDNFGTWYPSGNVDLSCVNGTGYIAFKYVGSGQAAFDGTYELDDISIDAQ
jgi:hypothetical protein